MTKNTREAILQETINITTCTKGKGHLKPGNSSYLKGHGHAQSTLQLISFFILSILLYLQCISNSSCFNSIRIYRIPLLIFLSTIYFAKAFSWTIWWMLELPQLKTGIFCGIMLSLFTGTLLSPKISHWIMTLGDTNFSLTSSLTK